MRPNRIWIATACPIVFLIAAFTVGKMDIEFEDGSKIINLMGLVAALVFMACMFRKEDGQ